MKLKKFLAVMTTGAIVLSGMLGVLPVKNIEISVKASTAVQKIKNYDESYISGTYDGFEYELESYATGGSTLTIYDDSCYTITGYDNKDVTSITIPEKINNIPVEAIGDNVFGDYINLTTVNLPETVTYIGRSAFYNCTSLTDFNALGEPYYDSAAFENCSGLEEIVIYKSLAGYVFPGCDSLKKVILSDNVETIAYDSFKNCYNIEYIEIGAGLTDVSNLLSQLYHLKEISVSQDNPSFVDIDGVLFDKDCTELIKYPQNKTDKNYKIIDGVKKIEDKAFDGCINLVSVDIPNSVSTIGDIAFRDCSNLKSIAIPDSVVNIGDGLFSGCSSLEDVKLNKNITKLGGYSDGNFSYGFFEYCKSLKTIVIPESVVNIEERTFNYCSLLEKIEIPNNVTSIGINAFADCTSLKKVTLPERFVTSNLISDVFGGNTNFVLDYDREQLDYNISDNINNKINVALSHEVTLEDSFISFNSYSNYSKLNDVGFDKSSDSLHEVSDADGNIYAICGYKDYVTVIPYNKNESQKVIENKGFNFGAATFDDKNNLYILWYYSIPVNEEHESFYIGYVEDEDNIVLVKYDKNYNVIGQCPLSNTKTFAQFPLSTYGSSSSSSFDNPGGAGMGNANIKYSNGAIGCFFDTQWAKRMSMDGLNHQGSEFAAIDVDTMNLIACIPWEGSHSLGLTMIPTDYGFAAIQIGDANHDETYGGAGINFNYWKVENSSVSSTFLTRRNRNGLFTKFHMSFLGSDINTNDIDYEKCCGNIPHMGGIAKSVSTYAIVGKSKRSYSYENYYTLNLASEPDDVFVRLFDWTLCDGNLAGEDRIDLDSGNVADRSVVWLTKCNKNEQTGEVKIVTLEDGSYCVLWEKYVNNKFDSIRYVILDECGYTLRRETAIYNARLSCTSIQPIVQNDVLTWAVADEKSNTVNWYSVDLNNMIENVKGDVNSDGKLTVSDVVLLQKWLLAVPDVKLNNWKAADFTNDGILNIFDLCLMKRVLIKQ